MKNHCILLLGLVGAAAQDPAEVCPDENTACLGSQPCADLIENGTPDAELCAANDLCTALTTCLDAASDSGGGGGGGEQTCDQCHDACGCDCNDQGCGDQTCQDCHSACDSGVCGSGGGGGGDGSGAGDGSGGGGGGGGDGGESTGSATGACGTTDREVADLCNVPGGVCHSFCVSSDASSTACDYRGSYVGPLVSFHDQGTAAEAAGGDMSATKIYRFAPPAFVGFPNNCNGPEFYEAVDASGSEFLGAGRKHVSFELYETTCSMTTEVAETIAEGEFKCETPMVPPILLAETAPESETAGKSVMTGKSFGVDLNSVRDKVSYRTDTQTDQTLMYQLFLRPASISKINFGDISATPRVCIQPECAAKSVTAGQFKFTVGTEIDDAVLVADTVRLVFKIALENGVEADGDALDATLGEQVQETPFLRNFIRKTIFSPRRQARDKHKETLKQKRRFSCRVASCSPRRRQPPMVARLTSQWTLLGTSSTAPMTRPLQRLTPGLALA